MEKIKSEQNIEIISSLKPIDYSYCIKFMESRVKNIFLKKEKELIWLINHDKIYTIGTSGKKNEIKTNDNIPIIFTNRGGKVTYHGPGQRIIYFMINLNDRKKDIRKFITLIEDSAIKVLHELNIEAKTFPDKVGIWVIKSNNIKLEKEEKIGAIGLRIKKWVTYHGLSFNLNPDLNHYKNIEACGLPDYNSTSLLALGIKLSQEKFDKMYLKYFIDGLTKL